MAILEFHYEWTFCPCGVWVVPDQFWFGSVLIAILTIRVRSLRTRDKLCSSATLSSFPSIYKRRPSRKSLWSRRPYTINDWTAGKWPVRDY